MSTTWSRDLTENLHWDGSGGKREMGPSSDEKERSATPRLRRCKNMVVGCDDVCLCETRCLEEMTLRARHNEAWAQRPDPPIRRDSVIPPFVFFPNQHEQVNKFKQQSSTGDIMSNIIPSLFSNFLRLPSTAARNLISTRRLGTPANFQVRLGWAR